MNDHSKLHEFLQHVYQLRKKLKTASLRPEDRDDPTKYVIRNQELAENWNQYENERRKLLS